MGVDEMGSRGSGNKPVHSMRHFLYSLWNTITLMSSKVIVELIAAKATDLPDIKLQRKINTFFFQELLVSIVSLI